MPRAVWRIDGPGLASFEEIAPGSDGGYLGTDYCDGVDTRWRDMLTLAPLLTTVDCGAAGGTAANTNGFETSGGMNATLFLYSIRGTKWAKTQISNMTLVSDGSESAISERATSIHRTRADTSGTEEISIGMAGTAYHCITTVGNGATDTDSANDDSVINRIIASAGAASASGQVVGLGTASSVENIVRTNILTGSTTMDNGNWQTVATFSGDRITFTGFAIDDGFWLVGTDRGPYYLDEKFREFRKLMPELPRDDNHCKNMGVWSLAGPGVMIPLARSLRVSRSLNGQSVGPETYEGNTSPIQGRCTAWTSSERWGYFAFYNAIDDDTWVCAVRPRQAGDWHGNPLSFYPLFKMDGFDSEAAKFLGTEGGRTLPTVVFGQDDDFGWFSEGRTTRFPDDTSYTYAASGTWYGTELRREPDRVKRVTSVRLKAEGLSADETVTVKISPDGKTAAQVGSKLTAASYDGFQKALATDIKGVFLKPQITLARGSTTTNSPKVRGLLEIDYEFT